MRIPDSRSHYSIIVPEDTMARAADYLNGLREGRLQPGALLRHHLQGADLQALTELGLLAALFDTKRPQIFAESAVAGDGSDWALAELGLLGDISVAVPVTIFDDATTVPQRLTYLPFLGCWYTRPVHSCAMGGGIHRRTGMRQLRTMVSSRPRGTTACIGAGCYPFSAISATTRANRGRPSSPCRGSAAGSLPVPSTVNWARGCRMFCRGF